VVAWDDSEATRTAVLSAFPELRVLSVDQWDYSAMASLVMSPGIMLNHPAVLAAQQAQVEVIGDIELLTRAQPNARYIGITGTNGKSTTTTLIAHVLRSCGKRIEVGGNLGTPALALEALGDEGIYVLELSSYQLDLVRTTKFQTAVFLNISPDHLDHHGSMERYVAAKRHIFDRMDASDVAIIGVDDAISKSICREMITHSDQLVIPIASSTGVTHGVHVAAGILHNSLSETELTGDISAIKSLQGAHNWQNAARRMRLAWSMAAGMMLSSPLCRPIPAWRTAWNGSGKFAACSM